MTKTKSSSTSKKLASPTDKSAKGEGFKLGDKPCSPTAKDCLAKIEPGVDGVRLHFVKCGVDTTGTFGPCNPNGLGVSPKHLTGKDPLSNKPYYEFRRVSLTSWGIYKKFLKTGNPGLLNEFVRAEGM